MRFLHFYNRKTTEAVKRSPSLFIFSFLVHAYSLSKSPLVFCAVSQVTLFPQPLQPLQLQPQPVFPCFLRRIPSAITPTTTNTASEIIIISIGFILLLCVPPYPPYTYVAGTKRTHFLNVISFCFPSVFYRRFYYRV